MATVEELETEVAALKADVSSKSARIKEVNDEAKGHRLNADNFRSQAEKAAAELAEAQKAVANKATEVDAAKAKLEAEKADAIKAAEDKAAEATTKAQQRAINADLRIAAKDAGAHDPADILALLDRSKIKLNDDGDVTNAADLLADMKKAKPHLFGTASTSNPNPPPPKKSTGEKPAAEWSADETRDFERRNGIRR